MRVSELAKELNARATGEGEFHSICTDSRIAGKNDLFVCFEGTETDGHLFAEEAVRRGASAILCEHELSLGVPVILVQDGREGLARASAALYGHPERGLSVIGVTGTNGKTTIAQMLYSVFSEAGEKVGCIGTLGAKYGEVFLSPSLTTPDPPALFSLLSKMKRSGVTRVVMEVSAHALALQKVCPIFFDTAIFTNLTQDHLDFFADMKAYGEAKRKLFTPKQCKLAVLNADDPFSIEIKKESAPVLSYGLNEPADCFAVVEKESVRGSRILLNLEDELCEAEIKLTGRHNVYNALAAASAARRAGVDLRSIARGIGLTRVDGRLERVGSFRGADIFVDFAHTPDGLQKSLDALRRHCDKRLFLVFGCGGNRDRAKRPIMGEIAAACADFTVITSDNPRFEEPCAVIAEIESGFCGKSLQYVCIEEREKAIAYALERLEKGDILLVAGKGGEKTQEIMGIKYAFDDKDVIRSLTEK